MHGMCPSVELMEHYQMDHEKAPTHFMRGTATEVWWNDDFEIMWGSATDCNQDDGAILFLLLLWHSILNIVSDDSTHHHFVCCHTSSNPIGSWLRIFTLSTQECFARLQRDNGLVYLKVFHIPSTWGYVEWSWILSSMSYVDMTFTTQSLSLQQWMRKHMLLNCQTSIPQ